MASRTHLYGLLSLMAGLAALAIAAGGVWCYSVFGLPYSPQFFELMLNMELLLGYIVVSVLFMWGTPFLCVAAILFGVLGRGTWPGRVGTAAALAAVVSYGLYLLALYRMFQLPGK